MNTIHLPLGNSRWFDMPLKSIPQTSCLFLNNYPSISNYDLYFSSGEYGVFLCHYSPVHSIQSGPGSNKISSMGQIDVEYPFITITPRPTLPWSGSTC